MTNFKMEVEIVEKENTQKVISVPVSTNWIGGQQATIKPNTQEAKTNFSYRVIISANENGVFDIEARTSKSVIKLHEKSLKFETIKKDTNVCFSYNIKHHIEDSFVIDVKSVKGDLNLKVHPNNTNDSLTINVKSEEEIKYEVTKDYRVSKNAQKGLWLICAETPENFEDSTFFTIHVYTTKNTKKVKEYKQLLYKLTKNDHQMYNLENIQATKPEMKDISTIPAFRALVQSSSTETALADAGTATTTTATAEPTILINGNGISGLMVIVVFAVPVLIGSFALMNTFVSTKFLDSLIKIKVME